MKVPTSFVAWLRAMGPAIALVGCGGDGVGAAEPFPSTHGSATTERFEPETSSGTAPTGETESDVLPAPLEEGELRPGGDTTVEDVGTGAFLQRAANLSPLRTGAFESGLQFFRLEWEPAPGKDETDGLGPTFNATSCIACHERNGRGIRSAGLGPEAAGVLLRLGSPSGAPDPRYGDQLQPHAIPGVPGEGIPRRTDVFERDVVLADGTSVRLERPAYAIERLSWGPLAPETRISPRIATQLVGLGLLEAIRSDDIIAWADPTDDDGDGVSGRVAWLEDGSLGRFGWKAAQPTVEHQSAAAFAGDLGITTTLHLSANCPPVQEDCAAAPGGGTPELPALRLLVTSAYVRLLGVPMRRDGHADEVRRGKTLFMQAGCDLCHRPSYTTFGSPEPELVGQRIWPYSDLLLHDMGEGLADGRAEGAASGREWRTPPLWGLGLVEAVNGALHLLHDGRAGTLEEAILWHAGEAEVSRRVYEGFTERERVLLHRFIDSL